MANLDDIAYDTSELYERALEKARKELPWLSEHALMEHPLTSALTVAMSNVYIAHMTADGVDKTCSMMARGEW